MTGVTLLTYADRLAGDLAGLRVLLEDDLAVFTGVHVLPFYTPFDGDDTGFDPVDHAAVDPRLGDWADVRALAERVEVTADLIVNHVSARAAPFQDWLRRGADSPSDGMFLTFDSVFPDGARERDVAAFHRPRPGVPFTPFRVADGGRRLVWTTFLATQVDLDVAHPTAQAYLADLAATLREGGVSTVRLDAVGYAVKTAGTDSFMTPGTLAFVERLTAVLRGLGLRVLVEVHAHESQQRAVAPLVDLVYDFATPPLVLHALLTGRVERLARWIERRPRNAVTVLDTHDGIGVIDAGPGAGRPGLLDEDEMAALFAAAADATHGVSARASVTPSWERMPHQINATFPSVLGGDPRRMLLARAVQVFLPGEPQFYYVGLLGGLDDVALFERTGQGRDVNRHRFEGDEVAAALRSPVARGQLALAALRRDEVFEGEFSWSTPDPGSLRLAWRRAGREAVLTARFDEPRFEIVVDGRRHPLSG